MDMNPDMAFNLLIATLRIVPDPVWFKDTKCRYVFCNEAYEAFSGFSCQDIIGKTDYDLFSRDVADDIVKHDMQAMLSFAPIEGQRPYYGKDRSTATATAVTKFAVRNGRSQLIGVLCIRRLINTNSGTEPEILENIPAPTHEVRSVPAPEAPEVIIQADEKYTLSADIRRGLEANEFTTFFQPKIDLASNRVIGAEALIRWKHPKRGHIPPSMFLPMAEVTGLIVPITELVLNDAWAFVREWNAGSSVKHTVSVNLSYVQLLDTGLLDTVKNLLATDESSAGILEFEVREALVSAHSHEVQEILVQLDNIGVGIVIDDFGSGHLDFTHLIHLPLKTLKIDRVFVKNVEDNPKAAALLRAMVAMTHELGMKAVAEGVETLVDRNRAKDAGCDMAQGYYWCKPLAKEDFMIWTQNFTSGNP